MSTGDQRVDYGAMLQADTSIDDDECSLARKCACYCGEDW